MNTNNPNAHLSDDEVEYALEKVVSAFQRCLMAPKRPRPKQFGCNSLLYSDFGAKRFLVFVRITTGTKMEEGTGPLPDVALVAAARLGAEPHIIRVHLQREEVGTRFFYFGYEEFIQYVISHHAEWF